MPFAGQTIRSIDVPRSKGINAAAVTSGLDTTTSATYFNMGGTGSVTSFTFIKRRDDTVLRVFMSASRHDVTSAGSARYGVNINSTDYDMVEHFLNAAADHQFAAAVRSISGINAGTYTVQARWRRTQGTGTPTRDLNDWLSVEVTELLPG